MVENITMHTNINLESDIFEFLSEMQKDIHQYEAYEFENKWYNICCELSGIEYCNFIYKIDFSCYQDELLKKFISVFQHNFFSTSKAIYFEYDLDNGWQSGFYICDKYNPLSVEPENEDWACDWNGDSIDGPDFPLLSSIYNEDRHDTFDKSKRSRGITLYLIARTVATFIEVMRYMPLTNINKTICIGFHDQHPIFRVQQSKYDV